ncbi:MAG: NusA-like transcription termination signal-binding factor [Candidatus Aenigmarchaeota archaeon]|nr:NusA-like transcription termination signal-binding factor [Candidatus Aenigmarchaeota archaeon]
MKLDTDAIRTIAAFVKVTGIQPRDCMSTEDCIYFLVDPDKMTLAIGKSGSTVSRLRKIFHKNVKLFGYHDNALDMIKGMIPGTLEIKLENGYAMVSVPLADKSRVIGRRGSNIKAIKAILKRHFNVEDVKLRA